VTLTPPDTITTDALRELLDQGAPQLVEVLPAADFEREHLPGAISLPLDELDDRSVERLDRDRPVVTYCYDHQCDLSARAAWLLASLGFDEVLDYTDSKVAWLAEGLPSEGTVRAASRAGAIARQVRTCRLDDTIGDLPAPSESEPVVVVVAAPDDVVLGVVRPEVQRLAADTPIRSVLQPAPPSVRPSITADELASSMANDRRTYVLVTKVGGQLLGLIEAGDLHGQH
jgi:rhodanese-related sulfurtransferase